MYSNEHLNDDIPDNAGNLDQAPFRATYPVAPVLHDLIRSRLSCGFPSPAESESVENLDLSAFMVKNPISTFFFRVQGHSMADIGLVDGSYLVVDRSIPPRNGHIVVANINGTEFTVKRLVMVNGAWELHAENARYQPIQFVEGECELKIWGVATGWVHKIPY